MLEVNCPLAGSLRMEIGAKNPFLSCLNIFFLELAVFAERSSVILADLLMRTALAMVLAFRASFEMKNLRELTDAPSLKGEVSVNWRSGGLGSSGSGGGTEA